MILAKSDLLLNARGSIYHLDLMPDDIADTIITVGDQERVPLVSKYFDSIECKRKNREFVTHTGTCGGKRLTVISTGIGTDNVDIVLTELDALVNIDLTKRSIRQPVTKLRIVRIGTSGSLQANLPVDSFVVSEYAIGLDNLMNFYQSAYTSFEKDMLVAFMKHMHEDHIAFIPYIAGSSSSLLSLFQKDIASGITVTCPGFYGPQGRRLRAVPAFPNLIDHLTSFEFDEKRITNFEMETAGIYGMSRLLNHEALSLSAIISNRIEKTVSHHIEAAIDRLIQLTISKLIE